MLINPQEPFSRSGIEHGVYCVSHINHTGRTGH